MSTRPPSACGNNRARIRRCAAAGGKLNGHTRHERWRSRTGQGTSCSIRRGLSCQRGMRSGCRECEDAMMKIDVVANPSDIESIPWARGCARCVGLRSEYHPGLHTWVLAVARHFDDDHDMLLKGG